MTEQAVLRLNAMICGRPCAINPETGRARRGRRASAARRRWRERSEALIS